MAGGATTPALAAAVCEVGGLGFLAAGYKTADEVAAEVEAVRGATSAPIGLNVFVVEPYEPDVDRLTAYRRPLEHEAARLGADLGEPRWDDDDWQAKLDLVLDVRPDVVSFTFGCPEPDVLRGLAAKDVLSMVTVTSLAEARDAVAREAASLSVQGPDAGGHRGTWDLEADPGPTPLLDLIAGVLAAVDVPVVAGGGGRTRVGGREAWQPFHGGARGCPAGHPHLHHLTAPLRAAAVTAGDAQVAHLWAGAGHAQTRAASAADITRSWVP